MIAYGDTYYYIDFKAIDKAITSDETLSAQKLTDVETTQHLDITGNVVSTTVVSRTYNKGKEIDGSRYAIINMLLETIIDHIAEEDTGLGSERALTDTPISFKIAFNSLLKEGIIKEEL